MLTWIIECFPTAVSVPVPQWENILLSALFPFLSLWWPGGWRQGIQTFDVCLYCCFFYCFYLFSVVLVLSPTTSHWKVENVERITTKQKGRNVEHVDKFTKTNSSTITPTRQPNLIHISFTSCHITFNSCWHMMSSGRPQIIYRRVERWGLNRSPKYNLGHITCMTCVCSRDLRGKTDHGWPCHPTSFVSSRFWATHTFSLGFPSSPAGSVELGQVF